MICSLLVRKIYIKSEQAAYLLGAMAAKMTTSKKIGVIGSENTPSIAKTLKGFSQGVSDTDAGVEAKLTYLGTAIDE